MKRIASLIGAAIVALTAVETRAQALVTDVSDHLVAITSSYAGTDLLLFGAFEGGGGDIVVVLRGPEERIVVRRKDQVFGIWANADSLAFRAAPSFYAVASNRPVQQIAPPRTLARLQIGAETLRLTAMTPAPDEDAKPFRDALLRLKSGQSLYQDQAGQVVFLGNQLFRTRIRLPSNVPIGTYTAEVYLFRSGNVVAAQTTPIFVNKLGFERAVFDWAHRYSVLYGLASVLIALAAGWLAAMALRRD